MSGLTSESGGKSSDSVHESYCFIHGAKSCKGDSSSPNLVHGAKWWLNNHGLVSSHDELSLSEAEVKRVNSSDVKPYEEENIEKQLIDEYYASFFKDDSSYSLQKVSQDCSLQEFGCMMSDDHLLSNAYSMDFESFGSVPVEMSEKLSSDLDSHWIEHKKIEPWWQTDDKNDVGLNVSQRSPHRIGKSGLAEKVSHRDLPRFQQVEHLNIEETNISRGNLASVTHTNISCTDDTSEEHGTSVVKIKVEKKGLAQCLEYGPKGTSSINRFDPAKVVSSSSSDTSEPTSGNLSRAQLLEALCHSQTRAREAEKLAQAACDEKDHIINLFFQQASCLFAYRQWLRLLQLETICLTLKSNDHVKSLTTPKFSSWPRTEGNTTRKNHQKAGSKKNHGRPKRSVRKCAIAFAVGMSLVGAGFLVGLTIGWFFPAF